MNTREPYYPTIHQRHTHRERERREDKTFSSKEKEADNFRKFTKEQNCTEIKYITHKIIVFLFLFLRPQKKRLQIKIKPRGRRDPHIHEYSSSAAKNNLTERCASSFLITQTFFVLSQNSKPGKVPIL